MKKKIFAILSSVAMILPFLHPAETQAVNFTTKTQLKSDSAIILNLDCDTVIHEKNADAKQYPGPLVNIMTAVVCMEECKDLSEVITIDEDVFADIKYNSEYIEDIRLADIFDGDQLTYADLLYAMMLTSSIEASQTIAYKIGGNSVSSFVKKMNEKAEELDLSSTHFTNPTGMHDPEQYTTARDMAKLTQYALGISIFDKVCSTYKYTPSVPNPKSHPDSQSWVWYHSNIMMDKDNENYYYSGVKGIKTGNLEASGRNIVAAASRDGNNYLTVCMKSPFTDDEGNNAFYHISDAETLFNWAFNHFSYKVILADTTELGEVKVSLAEGNDYVLARPKDEITMLWYDDVDISLVSNDNKVWYNDTLQAPVKKGDLLGKVTLEYSGEKIATVDMIAVSDVERSSSKYNLHVAKLFPKSSWFKKALFISIILCLIYILICVYAYFVFKSRSKPMKPMYAVPKVEKRKRRK